MLDGFPLVATIICTILAGGLGALWYGPLFGTVWLRAVGKTKEEIDENPRAFVAAICTWLVSATVYSFIISAFNAPNLAAVLVFSVLAWLGFGMVPLVLSTIFQDKNPNLLWIDGIYHLTCWVLMAIVHFAVASLL